MEITTQEGELASYYIETPRQCARPIKIDKILDDRLKAFMKARRIRHISFKK